MSYTTKYQNKTITIVKEAYMIYVYVDNFNPFNNIQYMGSRIYLDETKLNGFYDYVIKCLEHQGNHKILITLSGISFVYDSKYAYWSEDIVLSEFHGFKNLSEEEFNSMFTKEDKENKLEVISLNKNNGVITESELDIVLTNNIYDDEIDSGIAPLSE